VARSLSHIGIANREENDNNYELQVGYDDPYKIGMFDILANSRVPE